MYSRQGKKDKKESKSAEKKHAVKKNQMNLLIYKNNQLIEPLQQPKDLDQKFGKTMYFEKIMDRSKAKSSLAYNNLEQKKNSIDLLVSNKKVSISNWIDEQMKTSQFEKRGRNNYQYLHVIGKGGFGKVYKVKDKKTGVYYAMKEMSKAVILSKKSNDSVRNQRELLTILKHKFVVNMRQAFQDRETLYLIMDLMTGGDLRYHICKKHKFNEQQIRFFAACVFSGLEYVHSKGIIHRDIKPENLVFDDKGYLHLTDLGIAKELRDENHNDTSGTPGYMAPEVMTKQNHSYEVDFYALGVILYELMIGKRPYLGKDRKQIREQIMSKQAAVKKNEIPEGWSIEAADFINKLLQRRPMVRLGWGGSHQIKNHSWLRDFPWALLQNGELESPFKPYSKYNPEDVRYQPTRQDQQMIGVIRQNKILLRKSSVQQIFEGYTFEEESKDSENHTTSSQFKKKTAQSH